MKLRLVISAWIAFTIASGLACSPNQSPDQIRDKTAQATSTLKRDTKAVAEGVKEGLTSRHSVDLNKGSKDDLASLPGINSERAERIIAERPYANTRQLVTRHVLSEDEYAQVRDRVTVNP
jgi:DNA uptake protein ComE-like DNA-binding protein